MSSSRLFLFLNANTLVEVCLVSASVNFSPIWRTKCQSTSAASQTLPVQCDSFWTEWCSWSHGWGKKCLAFFLSACDVLSVTVTSVPLSLTFFRQQLPLIVAEQLGDITFQCFHFGKHANEFRLEFTTVSKTRDRENTNCQFQHQSTQCC